MNLAAQLGEGRTRQNGGSRMKAHIAVLRVFVVFAAIGWLAWPALTARPEPDLDAASSAAESRFVDIRIPASQDAYTDSGVHEPTGHLPELILGRSSEIYETLIAFDVAEHIAGARVVNARLELHCRSIDEGLSGSSEFIMAPIDGEWNEDEPLLSVDISGRDELLIDLGTCSAEEPGLTIIDRPELREWARRWNVNPEMDHGLWIGIPGDRPTRIYRFVSSNGDPVLGPHLVLQLEVDEEPPECPPVPRCTSGPPPTDCIPPGACPTATPGCPVCERSRFLTDTPTPTTTPTEEPTEEPSATSRPEPIVAFPAAYNSVPVLGVVSTPLTPSETPVPASPTPSETPAPASATPTETGTPTPSPTWMPTPVPTDTPTPNPFGTVCPPAPPCTAGPPPTRCIPPSSCPTLTPGCPLCQR